MSKKVSIEVGHGGADSGAVCGNIREKDINLVVGLELKRQLERHGVRVLISRTADVNDRAAEFFPKVKNFKPDVGIAVHTNAYNGSAKGFEVYRGALNFKVMSDKLCQCIEAEVKVLGQSSRGIKDSGFLMDTLPCPTAYCEMGFLDNPEDYKKFDTAPKQKRFGTAYAKGILKFFGIGWKNESLTESPDTTTNTVVQKGVTYRVIAGSFSDKGNAERYVMELGKLGVESFVAVYEMK